jgi:hypothetical protein
MLNRCTDDARPMPANDGDCCFITQMFYHAISIKHCTPEVAVERGVSANMRNLQILPPLPYDYRHVYAHALGKNIEFTKNRWLFGAKRPSITANSDGLEKMAVGDNGILYNL